MLPKESSESGGLSLARLIFLPADFHARKERREREKRREEGPSRRSTNNWYIVMAMLIFGTGTHT